MMTDRGLFRFSTLLRRASHRCVATFVILVGIACSPAPALLFLAPGCTHFGDSTLDAPPLGRAQLAPLVDKIVERTLDPKMGGATVELRTGRMIELGSRYIAVARTGGIALPAIAPASRLSAELVRFINAHAELTEAGNYLGVWQDVKDKLVYYDVTVLFPYSDAATREEALTLANNLGVKQAQKAIFDLGSGKTYVVEAGKAGGALTEM